MTLHWTTDICNVDATRIHYLRTGGAKPTLIALHGLTGSGACLTPLARCLATDFDLVMPDARGHGMSSRPSSGYMYPDHARDVLGLIRQLALDQPILLGHSMGGMTAAVAASQLGSAIRAVILVDPTFINVDWQREVFDSNVAEEHRQLLTLSTSDLAAQLQAKHPTRSAELVELIADARLRTCPAAFEVLTPPNPDYRELVGSLRVPTLLVVPETGIVSVDTARELQAINPLLTYELMPDAGHGVPYDQPERLGYVIKAFTRTAMPALP